MCWLSILVWLFKGYKCHSSTIGLGTSRWVEADCFVSHSNMGVTYPFHSPLFAWPCLPWPSSVSGIIPLLDHYLPASMGIDIVPLPYIHVPSEVCSQITLPVVFPHPQCTLQWMSMYKPQLPVFPLMEALLLGHWVTTLSSFSSGILFSSPLTEVVLHGMGLVHLSHVWQLPIHKGIPTSDAMRRSQFCGGLMTVCVGSSLHMRGHQPRFGVPPPKSLLPTYPWPSAIPSRHLPLLVPGHQVSSSLHLFFCFSIISVGVLLQLIGPAPPAGCSSIYLSQKWCTHPHSWQRSLLWGPCCCQWWGKQSQLGA